MTLSSDVDLEEYIMAKDDLSGADIKVLCLLLTWDHVIIIPSGYLYRGRIISFERS